MMDDLIDRYIDALRRDPGAAPPAGMDDATASFVRALMAAGDGYSATPDVRARIWQKALLRTRNDPGQGAEATAFYANGYNYPTLLQTEWLRGEGKMTMSTTTARQDNPIQRSRAARLSWLPFAAAIGLALFIGLLLSSGDASRSSGANPQQDSDPSAFALAVTETATPIATVALTPTIIPPWVAHSAQGRTPGQAPDAVRDCYLWLLESEGSEEEITRQYPLITPAAQEPAAVDETGENALMPPPLPPTIEPSAGDPCQTTVALVMRETIMLAELARRLDTTIAEIAQLNPQISTDGCDLRRASGGPGCLTRLEVGQVILLPAFTAVLYALSGEGIFIIEPEAVIVEIEEGDAIMVTAVATISAPTATPLIDESDLPPLATAEQPPMALPITPTPTPTQR